MKQLNRRIRTISPACPRCGFEDETEAHMLFFCPSSRASWFISPLAIKTDELHLNIKSVCQRMMQAFQPQDLALFFNTMWEVWKSRNGLVFRGEKENPRSVSYKAIALCGDIKQHYANNHLKTAIPTGILTKNAGCYGFSDGSWDTTRRAGIGIALFCHKGSLQHIIFQPIQADSPFHAEIMGLQRMLHLVMEMEVPPPIILCTDAESLVQFCKTGDEVHISDWRATILAQQLRTALDQTTAPVSLIHVPRNRNLHAHLLANHARKTNAFFRGYPLPYMLEQLKLSQELDADLFSF